MAQCQTENLILYCTENMAGIERDNRETIGGPISLQRNEKTI